MERQNRLAAAMRDVRPIFASVQSGRQLDGARDVAPNWRRNIGVSRRLELPRGN